mgnify:CR=1 FL=1
MAQALDLIVYGAVLFNECIRVRNIGFGLVIVVIGNEIFYGVLREELSELTAQLRCKRLVVCQNERRPVDAGYYVGHRKGLARTGDAKQHLLIKAVLDSVGVDVSDTETANIYSLVLTQVGGTEQDLSDKISALSLFDCTLAFANNGKPIGSPDNGGYFTLHTTEQGSTDVAYSGVTAVTIK